MDRSLPRAFVVLGDVGRVHGDALITAVMAPEPWNGLTDEVIYRTRGQDFHRILRQHLRTSRFADTVVVSVRRQAGWSWSTIVFVVDQRDDHSGMSLQLRRGLVTASDHGLTRVVVPVMGANYCDMSDSSLVEALGDIAGPIVRECNDARSRLREIVIVTDDTRVALELGQLLR